MKLWMDTWRVEPPDHTVMGRYGASMMDVAYSHLTNKWYHVWGGHEEEIAEPQMLFLDADYARQHPRKTPAPRAEKSVRIRKKREEQLILL